MCGAALVLSAGAPLGACKECPEEMVGGSVLWKNISGPTFLQPSVKKRNGKLYSLVTRFLLLKYRLMVLSQLAWNLGPFLCLCHQVGWWACTTTPGPGSQEMPADAADAADAGHVVGLRVPPSLCTCCPRMHLTFGNF